MITLKSDMLDSSLKMFPAERHRAETSEGETRVRKHEKLKMLLTFFMLFCLHQQATSTTVICLFNEHKRNMIGHKPS